MTIPELSTIEQCVKEGWAHRLKTQVGEGCRMTGLLKLNKVPGNIHFAPGSSFEQSVVHLHDLRPFIDVDYNMSFKIDYLSFGKHMEQISNPLDGITKIITEGKHAFKYFLKVVSSEFNYSNGFQESTNQFAVTGHDTDISAQEKGLPGLFLNYDISAMVVIYTQTSKAWITFITSICAIVGGVFTLAKILDVLLYQAETRLLYKNQVGKAT